MRETPPGAPGAVTTQRRSPAVRRVFVYSVIFLCQFAFLGYLLSIFASPPEHVKMFLEEKPTMSPTEVIIPLEETLNSLNLFSGGEFLGLAPGANLYRRSLAWDEGQYMWLLLEEKVKDRDLLMRLCARGAPDGVAFFRQSLQDGILNFFYDLGSREDLFKNNWGAVGVKELQVSALMPWTKKLDFIVLSSFEPAHLAGLAFIARLHPSIPVLAPPLPVHGGPMSAQEEESARALRKFTNLTSLKPGCWALTDRLRVLISRGGRAPRGGGWELDLLVRTKKGWCLVAGNGSMGPLALVRRARRALKKEIYLYVGGTGMMIGADSPSALEELRRLKSEAPLLTIVPNTTTSPTAHDYFLRVFGSRYRPGRLGERIKL